LPYDHIGNRRGYGRDKDSDADESGVAGDVAAVRAPEWDGLDVAADVLAERETGGDDCEDLGRGLSDEVAGEGADRHGDEHCRKTDRGGEEVDEGDGLELFESL